MYLDKQTFATVIENAPLVSIDLVVLNRNGKALLGKRLNKPAQGYWFVPGGRVMKNEQLEAAFRRLTEEELGSGFSIEQAELQGVFTHIYDDSVYGDKYGTHYVAISYCIIVNENELQLPMGEQHNSYKWFNQKDILASKEVHLHTKWYFNKPLCP